jgi:hypothetical protein
MLRLVASCHTSRTTQTCTAGPHVRRQDPEGRQTGRPPGATTQPDDSAVRAAARGPSHTVGARCEASRISGDQAGVELHAAADHGLALLAPGR